jgi:hypothetical protein
LLVGLEVAMIVALALSAVAASIAVYGVALWIDTPKT